ncbi:hypothetical protein N7449_009616 [Penicillium cf. viridicatum]|uniref:Uncharacterized protein n=1 Tax=Penicillium cf. viridicatum TaxID=2972119 RepID=A0A9W9JBQ0_9EURO|nr:hypothetical protein N7449_009616 [Penicillium cf. viridicatum]
MHFTAPSVALLALAAGVQAGGAKQQHEPPVRGGKSIGKHHASGTTGTGVVPTGVVPTGVVPTGVVPTGVVPTGIQTGTHPIGTGHHNNGTGTHTGSHPIGTGHHNNGTGTHTGSHPIVTGTHNNGTHGGGKNSTIIVTD